MYKARLKAMQMFSTTLVYSRRHLDKHKFTSCANWQPMPLTDVQRGDTLNYIRELCSDVKENSKLEDWQFGHFAYVMELLNPMLDSEETLIADYVQLDTVLRCMVGGRRIDGLNIKTPMVLCLDITPPPGSDIAFNGIWHTAIETVIPLPYDVKYSELVDYVENVVKGLSVVPMDNMATLQEDANRRNVILADVSTRLVNRLRSSWDCIYETKHGCDSMFDNAEFGAIIHLEPRQYTEDELDILKLQ